MLSKNTKVKVSAKKDTKVEQKQVEQKQTGGKTNKKTEQAKTQKADPVKVAKPAKAATTKATTEATNDAKDDIPYHIKYAKEIKEGNDYSNMMVARKVKTGKCPI